MDKQQASNIIKDTFEKPFEKARYTVFIKNLLNKIEDAPFTYKGNYIPDAFEEYVTSLERIGKYNDGENKIDILIVQLKKETSIERARTMQRNFIARYLNGSRGGEMKDAALVAFVSPNTDDWRFSLVKMEYRFEQAKSGKTKVKEEFTPARRWSFLVGANENSHTAQSRLVPRIADDEHNPTLSELEEAFNIEKVTREFFEKYRELFIWTKDELDKVLKINTKIKDDFENKNVNTVDFAKKLIGQIIFLYFLQKKGWFGVQRDAEWGTGSKKFLRELFEQKHGKFNNFFNDILEPLFYEALRIDRSHDDHYYSRFNCNIPFLNGGLFDPMNNYDWVHTDVLLPNELFSNTRKTKEGDTGNGTLDIFDRYNFTVKEDEPLEKEVAIDPELLGKAYEKFNAIRPDNYQDYLKALKSGKKGEESKFNKQYGVYYTPREIVHYMCQQSLINYLHTELNDSVVVYRKLDEDQTDMFPNKGESQQLDLTIENRSKPVIPKDDIETLIHYGEHVSENEAQVEKAGKETVRYYYKLPESIRMNAQNIDRKLAEIKVCDPAVGSGAFPVGMMSEIVKTRNVLSAFIKAPDRMIYNFKRECIEKSLYGVDIDPGAVEIAKLRLWLSLVVDEQDIKQIKPLPNLDYKIVCGNSLLGVEKNLFNDALFKELERLKPLLFNETSPRKKQEYKKQIDDLIIQITNGHKEFDFQVYFSEVFHEEKGFDVVIANPPYGVKFDSNQKKYFKEVFRNITERIPNSFLYFIGKGFELTRKNVGILSYIIPNEFLFQVYMTKARRYFLQNADLLFAINIGEEVFEAIVPTCIIALQNRRASTELLKLYDLRGANALQLLNDIKFDCQSIPIADVLSAPNSIFTFDKNKVGIRRKILNAGKPLENYCIDIANGISTSYDDVYIVNEGDCKIHSFEKEFLRPCIRGGQFNKYRCPKDTHDRLLYITSATKLPKNSNIYKYLLQHKENLIKKSVEKKNGIREWHVLFRSRYSDLFTIPKIIVRQTGDSIIAAVDDIGYYCIDSVNVIKLNPIYNVNILYFVALLNSRALNFYYHEISQEKGRVLAQVKPLRLRQLSIPEPLGNLKSIYKLVDCILAITKDEDYLENPGKQSKVKDLEREIDQMVYKLYGLTEEEIIIVEGEKG